MTNINKEQKTFFHIDMDAFYVSVETLLHPQLKGKAVVVGQDHPRGVVAASSYEARKYGVFSAMSCVKAKQLCPHIIFVYSGRKHYLEYSKIVMDCIKSYSPLVEVVGIDEAYLDASGIRYLHENVYEMAKSLQKDIFEKTKGLTCSIGIAPLKFLAKIASDLNKPDGISMIQQEEVYDFLGKIDLYKIPQVGKKFLNSLHALGIYTGADARFYSKDFLENKFGKQGVLLYERVNGIDNTVLVSFREAKSESSENTLEQDTDNKEELKIYLKEQATRVGQGLREKNKKAGVVTLKIKYEDFNVITRQISLSSPICTNQALYETACFLLDKEKLLKKVRLIGVGASQFDAKLKEEQGSLFELEKNYFYFDVNKEKQREQLDRVIDAIQEKYGKIFK